MKLKKSALLKIALILLALVGCYALYLSLIGFVPTGYGEVETRLERLRAEATTHAQKETAHLSRINDAQGATTTATTASTGTTATTPRLSFAEHLTRLQKVCENKRNNDQKVRYWRELLDERQALRATSASKSMTHLLSPDQRQALASLNRGSAEYDEKLYQILKTTPRFATINEAIANYATGLSTKATAGASTPTTATTAYDETFRKAMATPPNPDAAALLSWPEDEIPLYPEKKSVQMNPQFAAEQLLLGLNLFHAWLGQLAGDPQYDAAAGIRRIHRILNYSRLANSPGRDDYQMYQLFLAFPFFITYTPATSRPTLNNVTQTLLWLANQADSALAREYECHLTAAFIHDRLHQALAQALTRERLSEGAFSYIFDGKLERAWLQVNLGAFRHRIDLYCTALAKGESAQILEARIALLRHARWINLPWSPDLLFTTPPQYNSHAYRSAAQELALWAYRRDHGHLPKRLQDLGPDYLPSSTLEQRQRCTMIIQDRPGHPVLWLVWVYMFTEAQKRQMADENTFKHQIKQMEQYQGRSMNQKEILKARRKLERLSKGNGELQVGATILF